MGIEPGSTNGAGGRGPAKGWVAIGAAMGGNRSGPSHHLAIDARVRQRGTGEFTQSGVPSFLGGSCGEFPVSLPLRRVADADQARHGADVLPTPTWPPAPSTASPASSPGPRPRRCERQRPRQLPTVEYHENAVVRKVSTVGDVRWRGAKLLAGNGLVGEFVRIEEIDNLVNLWYGAHRIRQIPLDQLRTSGIL